MFKNIWPFTLFYKPQVTRRTTASTPAPTPRPQRRHLTPASSSRTDHSSFQNQSDAFMPAYMVAMMEDDSREKEEAGWQDGHPHRHEDQPSHSNDHGSSHNHDSGSSHHGYDSGASHSSHDSGSSYDSGSSDSSGGGSFD